MSPALWGAAAGAMLGGVSLLSMWLVAQSIESRDKSRAAQRTVGILKAVALFDVLLFPILGYFLGPIVVT